MAGNSFQQPIFGSIFYELYVYTAVHIYRVSRTGNTLFSYHIRDTFFFFHIKILSVFFLSRGEKKRTSYTGHPVQSQYDLLCIISRTIKRSFPENDHFSSALDYFYGNLFNRHPLPFLLILLVFRNQNTNKMGRAKDRVS